MKTKLKTKHEDGIGILALGLLGGIGALVIGIGLGLGVYALKKAIWTEPKPAVVTNINGQAQSPFTVGHSN